MVIFNSTNSAINYSIICTQNIIFKYLEMVLYKKYPEYKNHISCYITNGRKIRKTDNDMSKSLREHGIEHKAKILIYYE